MGVITQKLRKEVVSYEIVDQVTSFSCDNYDGDIELIVSSNFGVDGDFSLLRAKQGDKTIRPLNIRIEDDNGDTMSEISITSDQAIEMAHSLIAMVNFIKSESKYTEVV